MAHAGHPTEIFAVSRLSHSWGNHPPWRFISPAESWDGARPQHDRTYTMRRPRNGEPPTSLLRTRTALVLLLALITGAVAAALPCWRDANPLKQRPLD
jgi:hypothetical protein